MPTWRPEKPLGDHLLIWTSELTPLVVVVVVVVVVVAVVVDVVVVAVVVVVVDVVVVVVVVVIVYLCSKQSNDNQWWELFDKKTNKHYYFNATLNKTVWKRPMGADNSPSYRYHTEFTPLIVGTSDIGCATRIMIFPPKLCVKYKRIQYHTFHSVARQSKRQDSQTGVLSLPVYPR